MDPGFLEIEDIMEGGGGPAAAAAAAHGGPPSTSSANPPPTHDLIEEETIVLETHRNISLRRAQSLALLLLIVCVSTPYVLISWPTMWLWVFYVFGQTIVLTALVHTETKVSIIADIVLTPGIVSLMPAGPFSDRGQAWIPDALIAFAFRGAGTTSQYNSGSTAWNVPVVYRTSPAWRAYKTRLGYAQFALVGLCNATLWILLPFDVALIMTILTVAHVCFARNAAASESALALLAFMRVRGRPDLGIPVACIRDFVAHI
jgi:hypothetical protein